MSRSERDFFRLPVYISACRVVYFLRDNLGNNNSDAAHIKRLRGPQVPYPCTTS